MASIRNQPQYDFLAGGDAPSPPKARAKRHEDYRQNQPLPQSLPTEELHARIRTLEYELATLKQEKEVTQLQHEQDVRGLQEKAEEDFRRSQKFESANAAIQRRYDALLREMQDAQAMATNEKSDLERRLRTVTGQKAALEEERDEALEQLANFERENGRSMVETEAKYASLQRSFDLLREDFDTQVAAAQAAQQKLAERESQVGQLESEIVALKAAGGSEEVDVLKRQLSEQVTQIKRLEKTNRAQSAELAEYRKSHKSLEVVEEEKRGLEAKLKMMQTLRDELAQCQLRVQVLEEEKNSWASYLDGQLSDEQFESPADLARAFMQQRIENASLVEQLGAVKPELNAKDETIRDLEEERARLQTEVEQLKAATAAGGGTGGTSDAKARARLERQKALAIKESEYLRAQLKAMDDEEQEFHPERHSEQVSKKIKELQDLVDEHRAELDKLHAELSAIEKQETPTTPAASKKRSLDDTPDERVGELLRKNRKLQEEMSKYKTRTEVLEAEARAHKKQLEGLRSDKSSRHRILELRNNPTAQVQAIKQSTLDALREENETLRAQLDGRLPTTAADSGAISDVLIPKASLHSLQLALQAKEQELASKEKAQKRLRDIFAAKAHEFREAVYSLLGWKLEFQPNGRVKATSMFHPGKKGKSGGGGGGGEGSKRQDDDADDAAEEAGNFIVFDGENATMKISGGVRSEFANEIKGLVDFWVDGRGQVPCLLAAMTLEFFDRYHDQKGK
ncbi:uncharacterized protein PV09_03387 [Verruconis gallopava]|uniref:Spindle assembly checkpoint component MAD1 n=1 Tax=Verruconis gallopava TaxID=253628 RepID=A0A0D2B2M9_9PEZI|nr:uncharacterized protein PV09_03387 [Verruconis gallopava]KIW05504.1 hypothetical protein PV09_03387 [Verruconis gallopava]